MIPSKGKDGSLRMSKGDDVGQVGLQGEGHEFVHHGGIVGIGQIHEVLVIPLDYPQASLFGADPFRLLSFLLTPRIEVKYSSSFS